ncbi:MAG: hypothetical protein U0X76_03580 [Bacteroidia bacterium]
MNFKFLTELPLWWVLVCLLAGIGGAFLLYGKDHSFDNIHKWLRRLLFVLRALLLFFLSILLLSPLIKTFTREKEKPLLIFAQDNSQSIVLNKDSAFYRGDYKKSVEKFLSKLQDKYDVKSISWGDRVRDEADFQFDDKETDFSSFFNEAANRYTNRNIGAYVIASDGIYNRGSSPLYQDAVSKVPVYTVALGDTTVQKDLLISSVNYNKTVYLGNSYPVEVHVDARQLSGVSTTLTVSRDSSVIYSKEIKVSGNRFDQIVNVILEASKPGIVHYKISLSPVVGEMSTLNNVRDIYVEVIESRQKVLVIGNAPHPDLGTLKQSIESSQNYSVKVITADQDPGALNEYNLVILHNIPSVAHPAGELLNRIKTANLPVWYILGAQTSVSLFNNQNAGISISGESGKTNPVLARVNKDFSLFTVDAAMSQAIPTFPELITPFGQFRSTADNSVLLKQQIGSVTTDQPLQVFNQFSGQRIGVLCGEGIWRWRMSDYSANGSFDIFNSWVLKSVQNLSVRENKTHFRVTHKSTFDENETVNFDAEVYNDNFELINTPDVTLTITNRDNKNFPFTFSKNEKAYVLNAGYLPAGDYKYKATVKVGEKVYMENGQFSVTALQAEQSESVADHHLLNTLSEKSGGHMFYPAQLDVLADSLLARNDIKTISYSHYRMRDLVDLKVIFFLLLAILSLEWFLRKRAGGY